tara:strand:- start:20693 stop:21235 length:543 start_codon:yes stop_codon:yes gene_type:complete
MVSITRKCKDSQGGLDKIYLFKHINYSRSQIVLNDNILVTYPSTVIYEFEVNNQPSVNQTNQENEGGKFYDLSINFDLSKELGRDFSYMLGFDFNIIIKDRNGKFRFLGNQNGLTCNDVKYTTGGSKNSLNGVSLSFSGQEEKEAYYINNLTSSGFEIASYLLQEDGFNLLLENGFKILL